MSFTTMLFFIKETLIGMRRSRLMTLIAISIITITLIMMGGFSLILLNLNQMTNDISSKLDVRIFLKKELTVNDVQNFQTKLASVNGIATVEFIDKTVAWQSFLESYDHLKLDDYIDKNPLSHSLVVTMGNYRQLQPFLQYLKRFDSVIDDVVYGGKLADRVAVVSTVLKISGTILILMMVIASLFIIANTIRLTVIARNEEINIMRLVGATDLFIKFPFIFEGLMIGLIGSLFALGVIVVVYKSFIVYSNSVMPFISLISQFNDVFLIYLLIISMGTLIGMGGAYMSISKSLKVQRPC
tara:strand:- start:2362 stop:3258 length:897 start_codon:yes stop_codon:yes gene_type:complete